MLHRLLLLTRIVIHSHLYTQIVVDNLRAIIELRLSIVYQILGELTHSLP
jgi:hypothetical protein